MKILKSGFSRTTIIKNRVNPQVARILKTVAIKMNCGRRGLKGVMKTEDFIFLLKVQSEIFSEAYSKLDQGAR